MLKLFRCNTQIFWLWAGIFLLASPVRSQSEDDSSPDEDSSTDDGDTSYELQPESSDAPEETAPQLPDATEEVTPQFPEATDQAAPQSPEATEEAAPQFPDAAGEGTPMDPDAELQSEPIAATPSLLGSSCTLLPGIAKLTPSGDLRELTGSGTQFGLLVKHHMPVTGSFGLHYGLDLRMAKIIKGLDAPNGVAANPSSRFRQSDVFLLAIGDYSFVPLLGAFFDFGLGVQYRSFYINADSDVLAEDYYAGYGFGYVLRLGGQIEYAITAKMQLVSRLYFGFEGGSGMESGKLKYNHKKVDINARQTLVGLDLGVRF